jgi:hypothetical protein
MRKYPRRLKIHHLNYLVDYPKELLGADGTHRTGACVAEQQRIYVKKDVVDVQHEIVLWHEVLHAIACESAPTVYNNEEVIAGLALGVHSVVTQNQPWWRKCV